MSSRHALLIGVPRCDHPEYPPLDHVVVKDIELMRQSLLQSGYECHPRGIDQSNPNDLPTGRRIRRWIAQACAEAPPGGVLLIYFSGHGVSIDGKDLLLPADAGPTVAGALDRDSLVPLIPEDIGHSPARLIVFCVDACREREASGAADGHGRSYPVLDGTALVVLTGCSAGQRCRYGEASSYFTQILSRVLGATHPARTLGRVVDDVTAEMRRRAFRTDDLDQIPDAGPATVLNQAGDIEICAGDELLDSWLQQARHAALWQRCDERNPTTEDARTAVDRLVDFSVGERQHAQALLRERAGLEDEWFDRNYPGRVLAELHALLNASFRLEPEEAALLVAAPFLHEVVLAEGLREAADAEPTNFERKYDPDPRLDLELTHDAYQHVVQRARNLARRDDPARDAVAIWLVHRWLAARPNLWNGAAAREAAGRAAALLGPDTDIGLPEEVRDLARALLRAVGAGPVDETLAQRLHQPYIDDRWRTFAGLLWLAGTLAADPRLIDPVIADHLGTGLELSLADMHAAIGRLAWTRRSDELSLRAVCEHAGLHVAFADLVDRAAAAHRSVVELIGRTEIPTALPSMISADRLRPARPDGVPAYQVPVPAFRLSEDKVRELLMGRQLYGDPALAIRELYQNALDACRYRRVRLRAVELETGRTPIWTGRIRVTQGRDPESGREYIECCDNGVGMSFEALQQVFASAGERFVHGASFRAEQVHWQELSPDLRLIPNSQFGVGVFSYFMLADEIVLTTREVDTRGIPAGRASQVHVASSGSLLRIVPYDGPDLDTGGTIVRLFLSGEDRVSVLQTLRHLVWVCEFALSVAEDGVAEENWEPDALRYPEQSMSPLPIGSETWWVTGEGGIAADGLRTNENIFGLIVNLRDKRRPHFTVDRNTLRNWDKRWVDQQIDQSLPRLMEWPGLTLAWLWKLTESAPRIAQRIFDELVRRDQPIVVGGAWGQNERVQLGRVGCLPEDRKIFDPTRRDYFAAGWLWHWRAAAWDRPPGPAVAKRRAREALSPETDGRPVAGPIDASILATLGRYDNGAPITPDQLLAAAHASEESIASTIRRARRFAVLGLPLRALADLPPVTAKVTEADRPLLPALAAWTPPRRDPRPDSLGWLVHTSSATGLSIGEIIRRVERYVPAGWRRPVENPGELLSLTCDGSDVTLMSENASGLPPWRSGPMYPADLANVCSALNEPFVDVLERSDRLRVVGVRVAGRDRYPDSALTETEFSALRLSISRADPDAPDGCLADLAPAHLIQLASQQATTVPAIVDQLSRLVRPEILAIELPDPVPLEPINEDFALIISEAARYGSHLSWRNQMAVYGWPLNIDLVIAATQRWGSASDRSAAEELLSLMAKRLPAITVANVFEVAGRGERSMSEAARLLENYHPGLAAPDLPESVAHLRPTWLERIFLSEHVQWGKPWVEPSVLMWAWYGHWIEGSLQDFVEKVQPYRPLGAPVPSLSPLEWEAMRLRPIDEVDDFLIDDYEVPPGKKWNEHDAATITALRLVRGAGQFGWTVKEVHDRMARLLPFGLRLAYDPALVPGTTVDWQDLVALTRDLTGQEPALTGAVDAEHIAWVAAELDEPATSVVDRLRPYAELFAFHLVDTQEADRG
ncbi:caspase family protein [Cryptosporangium sp. NPDC048952]|uniref:wHTH domain-containing protein n=1 Tax=Cryptosporangium sp. NPDC048952 TaxID=3363961 RepID=UPI00371894E4